MSRLGADALLLATAAFWGVTFVMQKDAAAVLPPLAFVAARFLASAVVLAPLALVEHKRASRPARRGAVRLAAAMGVCLFLGTSLQQAGLATTSATNGGFLTACYVALTPFVFWALSGIRPRSAVIGAGIVSLLGAYLLATGGGPAQPPTIGDGLVLMADVAWAAGIALTPLFLIRAPRPLTLAFAQYAICGTLAALASLILETAPPRAFLDAAPDIAFAGLLSGALAYTLQIVAQRYTPPAEAALILSLESVFAAGAGALLLGERLTPVGVAGCALILLGAIAAEAAPWLSGKAA
ncbi:MAG: DMT family transporter [Hyphomicrobiales bacterium]|nr:DMT family transporter [Hyphomicrobiales bacterium]